VEVEAPMIAIARPVIAIFVLVGALVGCESATSIPSGAQQVHVAASETEVHLDPATVRAGDVYLVLDVPQRGVELLRSNSSAGVSSGMTDADLARVAKNADAEGIASEALQVSCCGKVFKEALAPGKYAIVLLDAPHSVGTPPASLAVLQVAP
jgi:hypothetical protein